MGGEHSVTRGEHAPAGLNDSSDPGLPPARAGSTPPPMKTTSVAGDHPRTRGEHLAASVPPTLWAGPSPHARGTPRRGVHPRPQRGTIPARAGNTIRRKRRKTLYRDHPRTRGEHVFHYWENVYLGGPSPHARGTRRRGEARAVPTGTIPARAGNTLTAGPGTRTRWDHPRTRGEHSPDTPNFSGLKGPSPHARGTQGTDSLAAFGDGTIPARAGNTLPASSARPSPRDHPRTRGEHSS